VHSRFVSRRALELFVDTVSMKGVPRDSLRITVGGDRLEYRADTRAGVLARPLEAPAAFDWHSAYGLHLRGKEWLRQREYALARIYMDSALARDPYFVPALTDRSMLAIRAMDYDAARRYATTALSVDTYDGAANYYYGLANRRLGRLADAKDGFEIAASHPEFRGAAWTELARLSAGKGDVAAAAQFAAKALGAESGNLDALGVAIVAERRRGDGEAHARLLARLETIDPLSHQARLERLLAQRDVALAAKLAAGVRSELPEQVLLDLAAWYVDAGDVAVALRVLEAVRDQPEALYWRAYLSGGDSAASSALVERANSLSPRLVFPFRPEIVPALERAAKNSSGWKPRYYLALAYWNAGRTADAERLLDALADQPDYAPFYASRASFPGRTAAAVRRDLQRAAAMDASEWRYGKLLAEQLLASGEAKAAADAARGYAARFPANYILGLTLAKSLLAAGAYREADALLEGLEVLPYEGAGEAHALYRQAKLKLAAEAIAAKEWSTAKELIAAARVWPERLGAGKPYDADTDERLEDSLLVVVRELSGEKARRPTASRVSLARPDTLRYGVGTWEPDSLGNHRAVVRVAAAGDAVYARIPWRRRDRKPEAVNILVVAAATQRRVTNVARMDINREYGDIVFQADVAGEYYVYYLPYTGTFASNYPKISYRAVESTADAAWIARHSLVGNAARSGAFRALPAAKMVGFDAANDFSRFTSMEYIASAAEQRAVRLENPAAPFLAFAEDRSLSIRMSEDIPRVWAERGAFRAFTGNARRGEYYTFQVGVWAHRAAVDSLRYRASALTRLGGSDTIPASAVTAFNLEGTDWSGRRFTRALRVDSGKVQPLWFGVDVPARATPGDYEGRLTLQGRGGAGRDIRVVIRVGSDDVANHGDDAPARLTRLRWLNSQLAADDSLVAPYTPMRVDGTTVSLLGRSLTFGADGMPASIRSYFTPNNTAIGATSREILGAPARLVVRDAAGRDVTWSGANPFVTKRTAGVIAWETNKTAGALLLTSRATLEFDGTAEYSIALKAGTRTSLADVRFELPMRADAAKYMMGLGQKGGFRPEEFHWKWDVVKKNQDAAWLGDVNAGLQFTLKDEHYVRPLNTNFYLSKPLVAPRSWANGGKGGCDITRQTERVLVSCYSGSQVIEAGDSLRFDFRLMITPFKPLDTQGQWGTRFFHAFVPIDSIQRRGANTVNVHHANRVNPWINYPFIETAAMRAYVDSAHARGLKAKIYYTVRELTNHAPEIFALRSLGDEVLSRGPGGGFSWLQEHLGDDYLAAWHVPENKDAAVVNSGVSRWHNFYIEGLDWLVKNEKIDGLYLDDVAFDRITMKRVRKVLDRGNPGALLDLHSANQYNPRDGFASSANLYLEHFPFLNRLWFGEYFDYDSRPDYWLVEISGIPFGLMGEMLEKGGNPWRGMTLGMTARLPWSGDPAPLWKVWDAFGIQQSRLQGWWSGLDPVTTSDANVLATTWIKAGSAMVSVGSWRDDDVSVRFTIDWKALGLDPARTRVRAPAIDGFQEAASWAPDASITVPGKKGLLLILEQR
jgi:predicted Zn-dependent protease